MFNIFQSNTFVLIAYKIILHEKINEQCFETNMNLKVWNFKETLCEKKYKII